MSWAGIGSIAGTVFRQYGAWRAGREAKKGTKNAMRRADEAQAKVEAEQRPWAEFGMEGMDTYRSAMQRYEKMMDKPAYESFDYEKTPGYQFRLQEGLKSIGIADGNTQSYLSGAQIKAAQRYAQDFASTDYRGAYQDYLQGRSFDLGTLNAYMGNVGGQLGIGQRASEYLSGSYTGYGKQMGDYEMRLGDINASVHIAQSEAAATGVENYFGSGRGSSVPGGGGGGGGSPMGSGFGGGSFGGYSGGAGNMMGAGGAGSAAGSVGGGM